MGVLVSLYSEPSSLALSPCLLFISSSIHALCYYPFGCVPKVPRAGTSKITGFTIISHIQNAMLEKMDRKCGEKSRRNLATVMKMMNHHQICGYTWIHNIFKQTQILHFRTRWDKSSPKKIQLVAGPRVLESPSEGQLPSS